MHKPKKIAFKTLGCRLNQYETDAIASDFDRAGYVIVDFDEQADVYVVNTCTVTKQGDLKSRQEINKTIRNKNEAVVVMTGCMVNNYSDSLEKFSNVDYFVENDRKNAILQIIDAHFKGEHLTEKDFIPDVFGFNAAKNTFHTRSMIKIQDGCNNFCSYCIVPKVRGRAVSRPVNDIISNISQILEFGYKEIVLTGVNIGRYSYEGTNFEQLVEKILYIPGEFRVRISSIEPEGFGDQLIALFDHPKLTQHLHLCLQSGSDMVLKRMRRFYTVREFLGMINKIRNRYPDFNFTTDIIVGFPGETETDFEESVKIARDYKFGHIHTFKYSVRKGTKAATMADQIPEKIKSERSRIIRQIADHNKLKYRTSLLGLNQKVLVEKINNKVLARGLCELYVPVEFFGKNIRENEFALVKLESVNTNAPFTVKGICD